MGRIKKHKIKKWHIQNERSLKQGEIKEEHITKQAVKQSKFVLKLV